MNQREDIFEKIQEMRDKLNPEFLMKLDINQLDELQKLLKKIEKSISK